MTPLSMENASVGRPAMFHALILIAWPNVLLSEKSSEQGMFLDWIKTMNIELCEIHHLAFKQPWSRVFLDLVPFKRTFASNFYYHFPCRWDNDSAFRPTNWRCTEPYHKYALDVLWCQCSALSPVQFEENLKYTWGIWVRNKVGCEIRQWMMPLTVRLFLGKAAMRVTRPRLTCHHW